MIGNIGREKGSLLWALVGSYIVVPFVLIFDIRILNYCSLISVILFHLMGRSWRREPYVNVSICRRFLRLSGWSLFFAALMSSFLYFNATIVSNNNEEIKLRDAVGNFLRSPMFQEFKTNTYKVYNDTWHEGAGQAYRNLIELLDPLGKTHALKVLELPKSATQGEIKERVRALSKKWHPDRHTGEETKLEAEQQFMQVQEAADVLLDSKRRRLKNKKKTMS